MKTIRYASEDTWASVMNKAIDKVINGIHEGVKDSVATLYYSAISKTPLAMGEAVGNWEFGFTSTKGSAPLGKLPSGFIGPYPPFAYAGKYAEAENLRKGIASKLEMLNQPSDTIFTLRNDTPHILLLENGGYAGAPVHTEDPYPPKYPENLYPRPFILIEGGGGRSRKAPKGMVKTTLLEARRIVHTSMARAMRGI